MPFRRVPRPPHHTEQPASQVGKKNKHAIEYRREGSHSDSDYGRRGEGTGKKFSVSHQFHFQLINLLAE